MSVIMELFEMMETNGNLNAINLRTFFTFVSGFALSIFATNATSFASFLDFLRIMTSFPFQNIFERFYLFQAFLFFLLNHFLEKLHFVFVRPLNGSLIK